MNTKLCVRDAEFLERAEQRRRNEERLRRVRMRVRDVIAADAAVRRALECAAAWDVDHDMHVGCAPIAEGHISHIYNPYSPKHYIGPLHDWPFALNTNIFYFRLRIQSGIIKGVEMRAYGDPREAIAEDGVCRAFADRPQYARKQRILFS